jgi:hypothetical protein
MTGVVVNGLQEARAALVRGERALESPPFAACHAGVGYYAALLQRLREEFPDISFTFVVCCGDDPAIAHEALRQGIVDVRAHVAPAMANKLQAIADGMGARFQQG